LPQFFPTKQLGSPKKYLRKFFSKFSEHFLSTC